MYTIKVQAITFFFELEILHVFDHNYKRAFLDLPLSPSFEIRLRSRKCVPITVSPTVSLSLNWILIRWHSGGNISVKTICSFHTGLYEFFFIEVFPYLSKEDWKCHKQWRTNGYITIFYYISNGIVVRYFCKYFDTKM